MYQRPLGKTGIEVSEIGLGCEHLQGMEPAMVSKVVDSALECGINIFDVFMSEPQVRTALGKSLSGKRERAVLQGHIGSTWVDGQYARSRDLTQCQFFFEDFMRRLETDYVDIGMLHFVDTEKDFKEVFEGGLAAYALERKKAGVLRAVGMSSHNPVVALSAVRTGLIDVLLFSLNPAYDLFGGETSLDDLFLPDSYRRKGLGGIHPAREALYRACEETGTAITVMKGLAAGTLLNSASSPFGTAMSVTQCIHYALTRPGVASMLVGCKTPEEVLAAVAYETAGDEQRDYSAILSTTPKYSMRGKCMYCNHCLPCPSAIDIAQVMKYLDLVQTQQTPPASVQAHYDALEHGAKACIACKNCETRCPFGVVVTEKMQYAVQVFGH